MKKLRMVFFIFFGIVFMATLLWYLVIIVLPWLACQSETLRDYLAIELMYCRGEAYDVAQSLVVAFGLMLSGFLLCTVIVFYFIKNATDKFTKQKNE